MKQDIYNKSVMTDAEYLEMFKSSVPCCLVECTNPHYDENTKEWGYPPDPNDSRGSNYWAMSKEIAPVWEFGDSTLAELSLGFDKNAFNEKTYLRFTDTRPTEHNYRIASGKELGANNQFTGKDGNGNLVEGMYDRRTSGGIHEAVSDRVNFEHVSVSAPKFFRNPNTVAEELNNEYQHILTMPEGVDRDTAVSVYMLRADKFHKQLTAEIEYMDRFQAYLENTIGTNHWENVKYKEYEAHFTDLCDIEINLSKNNNDIKERFNIISKDIPIGNDGLLKTISLLSKPFDMELENLQKQSNNILCNNSKVQILTQLAEKVLEESASGANLTENSVQSIIGKDYTVVYESSSDQKNDLVYLVNKKEKNVFCVSLAEAEQIPIGNKNIIRRFIREENTVVLMESGNKKIAIDMQRPLKEAINITESMLKQSVIGLGKMVTDCVKNNESVSQSTQSENIKSNVGQSFEESKSRPESHQDISDDFDDR